MPTWLHALMALLLLGPCGCAFDCNASSCAQGCCRDGVCYEGDTVKGGLACNALGCVSFGTACASGSSCCSVGLELSSCFNAVCQPACSGQGGTCGGGATCCLTDPLLTTSLECRSQQCARCTRRGVSCVSSTDPCCSGTSCQPVTGSPSRYECQ